MSSQELEEARANLKETGELTDKQAAILAAFDEEPFATFQDIAESASKFLEEGETVSGYYASKQLKRFRPEFFDDDGNRLSEEEVKEESAVPTQEADDEPEEDLESIQNRLDVSETGARAIVQASEESDIDVEDLKRGEVDGIEVRMSESEWLKLISFLYQFSGSDEGRRYAPEISGLVGGLTGQVLEAETQKTGANG